MIISRASLILSLVAFFCASGVNAAGDKLPSANTAKTEVRQPPGWIIGGGWAIPSGPNSHTIISLSDVPRWYVVGLNHPVKTPSVSLSVDGSATSYPVNADGAALVWGKKIAVKTYLETDGSRGTWGVYDPSIAPLPEVQWIVQPEVNSEAVVGIFDTQRDFVLSFNLNPAAGYCTEGVLTPFVDDKYLFDEKGGILRLQQGSSIIAHGKSVRIRVLGKCNEKQIFFGTIKLI